VGEKTDVWQGTLALMVLKTLQALGPLHGYGIARRIEQISGGELSVNYGTLYPALLKLEQEGFVASAWGVSENNRRAKFYRLTKAGRAPGPPRDRRVAPHDGDPRPLPRRGRGDVVRRPARAARATGRVVRRLAARPRARGGAREPRPDARR
jgi:transcriptional regulator